jgi:NTE family protein
MAVLRDLLGRRSLRTAFVLGGGGNLGAIQVGMLQALLERGVRPDILIGCSVGALNAAAISHTVSADAVGRLRDLWLDLHGTDIFPAGPMFGPWTVAKRGDSMYSNSGLRRIIETWLPFRRLEEATVPLHVVATSLRTGREQWFNRGAAADALLASAALPAVFPPVWIDGEPYIDGGVVDNVPISRGPQLGAKRVYVLHVGNFERERPAPKRPLDVLVQAFSIARGYRFKLEVTTDIDGVELITLPVIDPGGLKYNDFSRSRDLMRRGYESTAAFLDGASSAAASG